MSEWAKVSRRLLPGWLLVLLFTACTRPVLTLPAPTATLPPTSRLQAMATLTVAPTAIPPPTATPTIAPTATRPPTSAPAIAPTATAVTTGTILIDRLYTNPTAGVRWEAPADDWHFVELPATVFSREDVEELVTLVAPDERTSFVLALLSFDTSGSAGFGAALAANPDAFFEQTKRSLPPEAAETAERTEVAGAPALRFTLRQGTVIQRLHLILRPNGTFYFIVQAPDDLDTAIVEAGISTLAFTPPAGLVSPTAEPTPASFDAQRLQIISTVEQLRQLETLTEVPFEFMERDALRARLEQDLAEETGQAGLSALNHLYKLLGLIPAETELTELMLDLYTSQIAGFYDPEKDRFYLISDQDDGLLDAAGRVTFAHEYVHALQDQHYDLEALRSDEKNLNEDQKRAVQALIEGDAEIVTGLYIASHLGPADLGELLTSVSALDQETLDNTPAFLREGLLFPYTRGQSFVQAHLADGGWAAVDELYIRTPQSTEQILHPEHYPDDAPQAITLPDLASGLGAQWEELLRETWGEFDLQLLLAEHLPEVQARRSAEGWGGDQYLFLRDDAGNELFVLEIVWDQHDEGTEFADFFAEWLKRAGYQEQLDDQWQADGRAATVQQAESRTTVLIATQATDLNTALSALEMTRD